MKSQVKRPTGILHLVHTDADGRILAEFTRKNLVVDTGVTYLAARNAGTSVAAISHMAVGSVNTAPVVGNTALGTELGRVAASHVLVTTTLTNDTVAYSSTFGPGVATGTLAEAGLFNAGAAGLMVSRIVFPDVNKGVNDTVTATWSLQSH
jgi:hypothetical protein